MFDEEKVANEIIKFIKNYFSDNHLKGVVIGISGGKDSAVVASLFSKAIGSENILGLWMPCHSNINDKKDAYLVSRNLSIELIEHDLTKIYDDYVNNIKINNKVSDDVLFDANINIKPRLRMATLYYYASMMSKIKNGTYIVPGTSNKCERFVGYFTKGGDNVSDINILSNLTVSEVIKLGKYLGLPKEIYEKIPSDGLTNISDEEKLGIKYSDIETFIYEEENNIKSTLDTNTYNKISELNKRNLHKFNIPTWSKK